jgi:hypothetical protein
MSEKCQYRKCECTHSVKKRSVAACLGFDASVAQGAVLIANYTDGPLSFAATRQPSHIEMRTGTNPIT